MNLKICSGEPTPNIHLLGQTGAIVFNIIENFLGKSYQLYTNNFYNSFELAKYNVHIKHLHMWYIKKWL